jgi:hypothetical protein
MPSVSLSYETVPNGVLIQSDFGHDMRRYCLLLHDTVSPLTEPSGISTEGIADIQ